MQEPALPIEEPRRLQTLRALRLLDSEPDERFDRLTRLAQHLFSVPIALVSLVDENRQWFKSCIGLTVSETPRDISFCGHAILGNGAFIIPDARADERFRDNPLVLDEPHIRFYAGCPLSAPDGSKLGTLCIIDREPRHLDEQQLSLLNDLARMAENEIAALALATMDELTHLPNRRGFEVLSQHTLQMCRRIGHGASLLFFDLNGFKHINDTYGHAEGDRALVLFAEKLTQTFRSSDVIARISGDEFVVLAADSGAEHIEWMLTRLQVALAEARKELGLEYRLSFSVGTVAFDAASDDSIKDLLKAADQQMYLDKKARA